MKDYISPENASYLAICADGEVTLRKDKKLARSIISKIDDVECRQIARALIFDTMASTDQMKAVAALRKWAYANRTVHAAPSRRRTS